ncbi:MAG: acyl transferase [Reichenbachiella sp.]
MKQLKSFKNQVLNQQIEDFSEMALDLFHYQADNNAIYNKYIATLGVEVSQIKSIDQIPFMPIEFFKHHQIKTTKWKEEYVFLSSGTTKSVRSKHFIQDLDFYSNLSSKLFFQEFGELKNDMILGLLPSYAEQGQSSLLHMVDNLMSDSKESGYCLDDLNQLEKRIHAGLEKFNRVILFGVGYALLDFVSQVSNKLDGLIIIETGGMKGRREELTKEEFYKILKQSLGDVNICSEYGMTEMMSQCYSFGDHYYSCPSSVNIIVRDLQDPFSYVEDNKTGGINVIDLGNVHSCAFLETQDIGRKQKNGTFEVLGRIDNADIRGCNLLVG